MKGEETHASRSQILVTISGVGFDGWIKQKEWGGFNVACFKASTEVDPSPLFKGLPEDRCQCPHLGFLFKGKILVRYKDHEETINAGEAFYIAPGHIASAVKGSEWFECSPKDEFEKVKAVIMKNMQAMEAKKSK